MYYGSGNYMDHHGDPVADKLWYLLKYLCFEEGEHDNNDH